ncbi:MAG: hypothetical protein HY207_06680 [Nitrospirae bacterium]|nr:hypothetical protein [Nitrospirota bacterium]
MRRRNVFLYAAMLVVAFAAAPAPSWAHGVIGQRFFPESITVADPFPADEADLLVPSFIKTPDGKETSLGFGIQKRLSPNLGLSIEFERVTFTPADSAMPEVSGFRNPEITLKYAMLRNGPHEAIVSALLSVSPPWGDKGLPDAEQQTTLTSGFLFGKGWGDLPDGLRYLKPFALAGTAQLETPLGAIDVADDLASTLSYGLILEYSIPYLQSFVKDIGIPKPLNRLIPIVELSLKTPVNGPMHVTTEAFLNPGVLWSGKYVELGVEAQVPLNDRTGKNVGVIGLVHLFLDDLAPDVFAWTPFHGNLGSTQR